MVHRFHNAPLLKRVFYLFVLILQRQIPCMQLAVVLHLELCKGSGMCLIYTVCATTLVLLQWSVQSAQFRFCISWMDWTCCTCVGISVQSVLFRQLYAACIFWECKKCQLYRSSRINVISMVKAICANIIGCWQARSLCDLHFP